MLEGMIMKLCPRCDSKSYDSNLEVCPDCDYSTNDYAPPAGHYLEVPDYFDESLSIRPSSIKNLKRDES